jgi:hypothetical protein
MHPSAECSYAYRYDDTSNNAKYGTTVKTTQVKRRKISSKKEKMTIA